MMKALLIDPYVFMDDDGKFLKQPKKQVFRSLILEEGIDAIYAALSKDLPACAPEVRMIEAVYPAWLQSGDILYVDEEGLLNSCPKAWISIDGWPQPIAGRALVLGTDSEGASTSYTTSMVQFFSRTHVGVDTHGVEFPKGNELFSAYRANDEKGDPVDVVSIWKHMGRF